MVIESNKLTIGLSVDGTKFSLLLDEKNNKVCYKYWHCKGFVWPKSVVKNKLDELIDLHQQKFFELIDHRLLQK